MPKRLLNLVVFSLKTDLKKKKKTGGWSSWEGPAFIFLRELLPGEGFDNH